MRSTGAVSAASPRRRTTLFASRTRIDSDDAVAGTLLTSSEPLSITHAAGAQSIVEISSGWRSGTTAPPENASITVSGRTIIASSTRAGTIAVVSGAAVWPSASTSTASGGAPAGHHDVAPASAGTGTRHTSMP